MVFTDAGGPDDFAFIELNAESPAGLCEQTGAEATLFQLPPVAAWLAETPRMESDVPGALLRTLVQAHRSAGGAGAPQVAIVDWPGVDTAAEQVWLRDRFAGAGVPTVLLDPGDLRCQGGRLHGPAGAIDVVYRRVIGRELLARVGDDHPLLRAAREGAACVVNPFRSAIANRKAVFAVLSDPAFAGLFSDYERTAIKRHLPWTRLLAPSDEPELSLEDLRRRQADLVIKPNDDYGGKGVVLGWTATQEQWQAAIARGRAEGGVVQQRVACRRLGFVGFDSEPTSPGFGRLVTRELEFDCDPFLMSGRVEGAMVRVSPGGLANVSAGGGVTGLVVREDAPGEGGHV
jgi:uncharacterized circularly permuted ATP-grasp superfamily protein